MSCIVRDIFSEYERDRAKIEISKDEFYSILKPYQDKIVLYGAGSAGIAFVHYLLDAGVRPAYFSDGDTEKHGKLCEGIEIIPPQEIVPRLGEQCLVIVTINTDGEHYCKDFKQELLKGGHKGVHKSLRDLGCKNLVDYTYFRRCYSLFSGERYNLPACSDVEMMVKNIDKIEAAYALLHDDETRNVFLNLLRFRLLSDEVDIPTYPEKDMYFEYDLFPKSDRECFVDCGACGGSSLTGFLSANKNFAAYYGLEPDAANFKRLEQYVDTFPESTKEKMRIVNAAAYDSDAQTRFFVLNGPGTFQANDGPDTVKTVRIDTFLQGEPATYIKMNIEGSEIPALRGAEQTIKKYKPRLGIMGYHKTSDLWEVPLLVHEYVSDYKLVLRSYMKNVAFIYYAYLEKC